MIISEKKIFERKFFKNLRNKSSSIDMRNVEINVKKYVDSIFSKDLKKKYIGIYWPLKGEVDIRFIKEINSLKVALPSSSKSKGISYHHWSNNQLEIDSNSIPAPTEKDAIKPNDISILFVPAIAIDQEGYRLGYGGGYFDRLRQKDLWFSVPSFLVITNNCISKKPLPREKWDLPFNGWISEKGLHQIEATN